MLVYQNSLLGFKQDVGFNRIDTLVADAVKEHLGHRVGESEQRSWQNSLSRVGATMLADRELPEDAHVAIECQLPMSNKRIDFVLSGLDGQGQPKVCIVELKQWDSAQATDIDGVVRTALGGGLHQTQHPSYQAWSYAAYLEYFNEAVETDSIGLHPCAYLHNYTDDGVLTDAFYAPHTSKAPIFFKEDAERLLQFLRQHVKRGDAGKTMYAIENGRIRPSKKLADSVKGMLKGNQEFVLLDEQKVAHGLAMRAIQKATGPGAQKQVLIVRGGPGTGKSVVAINLLSDALVKGRNAAYVSKNAAPRAVYESKLTGTFRKSQITALFRGSGQFITAGADTYDALIVDEAHRLNEKSGLYSNLGENQIAEIIRSSRTSIFFLDERQRIHLKDKGSEAEIRDWASAENAEVEVCDLPSQFRCNGSDGYLAWLDNMLDVRQTAVSSLSGVGYEFGVAESAEALDRLIRSKNNGNSARIVAGYCWDWNSKKHPAQNDIVLDGYSAQWNLMEDGSLWITKPESIDQVGCIHTCQGLELDYIGVIIGPDLLIRNGRVVTVPEARSKNDRSVFGWKKMARQNREDTLSLLDDLIKNTYRTLMTRGMKGCFIYSEDEETREWFRK